MSEIESNYIPADNSAVDGVTLQSVASVLSIKDDGVTLAKLASGTANKNIGFDGAGDPAEVDAPGGDQIVIPMHNYTAIISGTWVFDTTTDYLYNCRGYNSSRVQNEELHYKCFLPAGTYTFRLLHTTYSNQGIVTLSVDGSDEGTIDTYSAGVVNGVVSDVTSIVVASGKWLDVKMKMATKNGSASAYGLIFYHMSFIKTA